MERADGHFEQQVALKILRADLLTDALRTRLRTERQILAQFDHPNVARVFDGGVTEKKRPYLVLEYVDGTPIDAYCRRHNCTIEERLGLFLQTCEAVQYSHRHLVVHRDLKPSNILVTEGGHVKLLDFGIAKLLEDSPDAGSDTQPTERWMTPHYAAPEQVAGDAVTTATDVYALGACLLAQNRPDEAEDLLIEAYRSFKDQRGPDDDFTQQALRSLVRLYTQTGETEKKSRYKAPFERLGSD